MTFKICFKFSTCSEFLQTAVIFKLLWKLKFKNRNQTNYLDNNNNNDNSDNNNNNDDNNKKIIIHAN